MTDNLISVIPTGVYQGAIFSRMVETDEVEPEGEVSYKGYCRVPVRVIDDHLHGFDFPESLDDAPHFIACWALLDVYNKVIFVQNIDDCYEMTTINLTSKEFTITAFSQSEGHT